MEEYDDIPKAFGQQEQKDLRSRLDEMFQEKNYWQRLREMFSGLKMPRETREYKSAHIELERQAAPTFSLIIPLLLLLLLLLLPTRLKEKEISYVIQVEEQPVEEIEELEEPEIVEENTFKDFDDMAPPMSLDIEIENPTETPPVDQLVAAPIRSPLKTRVVRAMNFKSLSGGNDYGTIQGKGLGAMGRKVAGDLVGVLYDFKRTEQGDPRKPDYWHDVKLLVEAGFNGTNLPYYRVDQRVTLSHLLCKLQDAELGPETFGVEGKMEPRQWVAHYSGQIIAPKEAEYRFAGDFDDCIMVWVNGKPVLDFARDGMEGKTTGLEGQVLEHRGGANNPICYGPWTSICSMKPSKIDILVGERPGGVIGGELFIQEKGKKYEVTSSGRPVLPVFCTAKLSEKEMEAIMAYRLPTLTNDIPIFGYDAQRVQESMNASKKMLKDDIEIISTL